MEPVCQHWLFFTNLITVNHFLLKKGAFLKLVKEQVDQRSFFTFTCSCWPTPYTYKLLRLHLTLTHQFPHYSNEVFYSIKFHFLTQFFQHLHVHVLPIQELRTDLFIIPFSNFIFIKLMRKNYLILITFRKYLPNF